MVHWGTFHISCVELFSSWLGGKIRKRTIHSVISWVCMTVHAWIDCYRAILEWKSSGLVWLNLMFSLVLSFALLLCHATKQWQGLSFMTKADETDIKKLSSYCKKPVKSILWSFILSQRNHRCVLTGCVGEEVACFIYLCLSLSLPVDQYALVCSLSQIFLCRILE